MTEYQNWTDTKSYINTKSIKDGESSDLNTYLTSGIYFINGLSITNLPQISETITTDSGYTSAYLIVIKSGNYISQILYCPEPYPSAGIYQRGYYDGNGFTDCSVVNIASVESIDANNIFDTGIYQSSNMQHVPVDETYGSNGLMLFVNKDSTCCCQLCWIADVGVQDDGNGVGLWTRINYSIPVPNAWSTWKKIAPLDLPQSLTFTINTNVAYDTSSSTYNQIKEAFANNINVYIKLTGSDFKHNPVVQLTSSFETSSGTAYVGYFTEEDSYAEYQLIYPPHTASTEVMINVVSCEFDVSNLMGSIYPSGGSSVGKHLYKTMVNYESIMNTTGLPLIKPVFNFSQTYQNTQIYSCLTTWMNFGTNNYQLCITKFRINGSSINVDSAERYKLQSDGKFVLQ